MFILKTSPQQSYAFKEGISFAPFLDLPFVVFHKNILPPDRWNWTSFCVCYFMYRKIK